MGLHQHDSPCSPPIDLDMDSAVSAPYEAGRLVELDDQHDKVRDTYNP